MQTNDFSKGAVWRRIVAQAIPLTVAQLVQLLYNVVDRIYIGHLNGTDGLALTGIGLSFPIILLINAFTNLYGTGGTPLFSMARGAKDPERAERILGNVFALLLCTSLVLMATAFTFRRPLLYLFGASDESYGYANAYLSIYLFGTPFAMMTTGLNGFINAQGYPKFGMVTTLLGALLNLILDPIFIFQFNMGVSGAALATIISQAASAVWVLRFLTGRKAPLRIKRTTVRISWPLTREIVTLGTTGFIMQGTNALVQIACNSTLSAFGGDLYIGLMSVITSVREVLSLPVSGLTSGAQPVMSFNYGAKEYDRVKQAIRFTSIAGTVYTVIMWIVVLLIPQLLISLFTNDQAMITAGPEMLRIYFFGFSFMVFQFSGQTSFQALGCAKQAIFFSLLRKAVIVVPLTLLLPRLGFGVRGVFLAEPISNIIGGLACFLTMWHTVYRKLGKEEIKTSVRR